MSPAKWNCEQEKATQFIERQNLAHITTNEKHKEQRETECSILNREGLAPSDKRSAIFVLVQLGQTGYKSALTQ
jgi:hypothetical protein